MVCCMRVFTVSVCGRCVSVCVCVERGYGGAGWGNKHTD